MRVRRNLKYDGYHINNIHTKFKENFIFLKLQQDSEYSIRKK
jgi:hypothetical protein